MTCFSASDVDFAHSLLVAFYNLLPKLYPSKICTMNMHSLVHLSTFVHCWGPLWCYSCFGFESMNGHLWKHCHGTRLILPQLIHNIRMLQLLSAKGKEFARSATPLVFAFIESVTGTAHSSDSQCRTVEAKGRITHKQLNHNTASALVSASYINSSHPLPVLPTCRRIRHNSTLYSAKNGQDRVRDGSICIFKYESVLQFGSIYQFCFAKGEIVAIVNLFRLSEQNLLDSVRPTTLTLALSNSINKFVFCVEKLSLTNQTVAIPASSINFKCIHIPVKGSPLDFIILIPNMFEHH